LARLASQFANGTGNFSDIVFILNHGITDLTDWRDRGVARGILTTNGHE
jgi:hypothetical protein